MSDYTRSTVSTINGVNAETQKIQTAVNSKMDKSGGAFTGTVDMNEQRLINLPDATDPSEAMPLGQGLAIQEAAEQAAEGALDAAERAEAAAVIAVQYPEEGLLAAALAVGTANVGGVTSGNLSRKYGELVSIDDYPSISSALSSGKKFFVWPNKTYEVDESVVIPSGCMMVFNNTTIKGHFNDFLIKFLFPGECVLAGKLVLQDDDASVINSETTLTNGIQFGDTSNAIHGVDTSGLDVYCTKLKRSYYIGEFSYSNTYGVLRSYNCGSSTTDAFLMDAGSGLIAANDTFIKKIEITCDNTSTWNGAGLSIVGGYGVTIAQLHLESIYNANAAQFSNCNVNVLGGYHESVGAMATSCTVTVNDGATVNLNGMLINAPMVFNTKVKLDGCRFFKTDLHKNAIYINCTFPNSNQLLLDVTGVTPDQYPVFGTNSSLVSFDNFSGTWQEFAEGYTGAVEDLPFFGGDHALSMVNNFTTLPPSGKYTKISAGTTYMGASGFKLPRFTVGTKLFTWAIVYIPVATGVGRVRFGVGGILGSGSSNVNSITTITKADHGDKWMLMVQPSVTPFTSATYSNEFYAFFEAATEAQNSEFIIDSFGAELGGLSYKSILDTALWSSYPLKRESPPADGIWNVGKRCIKKTPTVGQPKAWVCTASPNTWVSEGNL